MPEEKIATAETEQIGDVFVTLSMSPKTRAALENLARMTGCKEGLISELVQDESRVYEWLVYRQVVKECAIVALPRSVIEFLEEKYPEDFDVEMLAPLVTPGKEAEAKEYFEKVAAPPPVLEK